MSSHSCMVAFCQSKGTIPGIPYFQLTGNRYNSWLEALGIDPSREKVSTHNRVCSVHFPVEDMIVTPRGKTRLRSGAIPKFSLGPNVNIRKSLIGERNLQTRKESTGKVHDEIYQKTIPDVDNVCIKEEEINIKSEDENDLSDLNPSLDRIIKNQISTCEINHIKEELQEEEITIKSEDENDLSDFNPSLDRIIKNQIRSCDS